MKKSKVIVHILLVWVVLSILFVGVYLLPLWISIPVGVAFAVGLSLDTYLDSIE